MNKILYNVLIYISLIFLCIALYRADYLKIPAIQSGPFFVFSVVFLFAGFIGNARAWQKLLKQAGFNTTFKACLASVGLPVFGKYVPGKVWAIIGRSAHIATKNSKDINKLTILSLSDQIIGLWAGLTLGFIGLCLLDGFSLWGWLIAGLWIILTGMVFSSFFSSLVPTLLRFIIRKDITLPHRSIRDIFLLLPLYFGFWLMWAVGFYLLSISIVQTNISVFSGLGFPLSGTIGILAIFSPGGLGVRESIMAGYLTLTGLSLSEVTTIAVTARLWFLAGEILMDKHQNKRRCTSSRRKQSLISLLLSAAAQTGVGKDLGRRDRALPASAMPADFSGFTHKFSSLYILVKSRKARLKGTFSF